ncbi:MAG: hypothetical protein VKK97_07135 [Synechococcaceae cyanobacterium]|nr:hypothetical protein [Synechococcaceae cyanobacterium]
MRSISPHRGLFLPLLGPTAPLALVLCGSPHSFASTPANRSNPYDDPAINRNYHKLFVDDQRWWPSPAQPSRQRARVFARQRDAGEKVPCKQVLGAILEVHVDQKLDVLAVYGDGEVRYINHSKKVILYQGQASPAAPLAKTLLASAQPLVNRLHPPVKRHQLPPPPDQVRLTLLVPDGLLHRQGHWDALAADPLAGRVLEKFLALLKVIAGRAS